MVTMEPTVEDLPEITKELKKVQEDLKEARDLLNRIGYICEDQWCEALLWPPRTKCQRCGSSKCSACMMFGRAICIECWGEDWSEDEEDPEKSSDEELDSDTD